jgi:EmrB/QacA subfamily drug resistance transporter
MHMSPSTKTKNMTRWVVVLTAIGSLMAALDTLVVSTALSTIRLDLGASVEQLEWTVNAYNLSFAVLLMTGAALGDRFGRRNLYALGLALFTAASAACALAPDVGVLIAARAVQGAGSALLMPLGLALLSAAFPPERRGAAIGIFSAITGLAVASGPLVGGAVVQGLAWQWIFWINVPIGLLAIPLVLTKMRESHGADSSLDLRGLALVTGGVLGLVWALVRGNQAGWGSPEVLGTLAVGALLIAAFVAWELRAREPMLPMGFFRSRAFSAGNAAIFLTFASLFGAVFFYAQLLQTGLGYGPLGAGLRLIPWTATFMTVAPIAGALVDRVGERPFMVGGLTLQAVGLGWLALIAEPGMAYSQMLAPFIVGGVGVSMAIPAAQNSVLGSVAEDALGKAAGTNSMMRELGGVFGVAVVVAVFAGAGSYASAQAFVDGFSPAILVAAGLALGGAAAGLALPGRRAAPVGLLHRVQEAMQ